MVGEKGIRGCLGEITRKPKLRFLCESVDMNKNPRLAKMSKRLKSGLMANKRRNWLEYHLKHQKGMCYWCGGVIPTKGRFKPELAPTCDHIIPTSKGGEDSFDNTCAAHVRCNHAKADLLPEEFCEPGKFVYTEWYRLNKS